MDAHNAPEDTHLDAQSEPRAEAQGEQGATMQPQGAQDAIADSIASHPSAPVSRGERGEIRPRSEMLLHARAIRRGWPITQAQRRRGVELVASTFDDPECSRAQVFTAFRLLCLADGVNVKRERTAMEAGAAALDAQATVLAAALSGDAAATLRQLRDQLLGQKGVAQDEEAG